MKAPEKDGTFEKQLIPEGLVDAKCYAVIDLGSEEFEYMGEKKITRKIQISFETQIMGKFGDKWELPLTAHITKTFTLYEKGKLYPLIKDWVDVNEIKNNIFDLVGKTAKLMISHSTSKKGAIYAEVLKIKPGEKDWNLINPEIYLSLDKDSYSVEEFNKLPTFLQDKIKLTPEYKEIIPF